MLTDRIVYEKEYDKKNTLSLGNGLKKFISNVANYVDTFNTIAENDKNNYYAIQLPTPLKSKLWANTCPGTV